MDPVTDELNEIEVAMERLPYEVRALVRRSRRAIAEAESNDVHERAKHLYLQLLNVAEMLDTPL